MEKRSFFLKLLRGRAFRSYVASLIMIGLSWNVPVMGAIVSASAIKWGNKQLYLLGDHHTAGKNWSPQEQLKAFIRMVRETRSHRREGLHVFLEQGDPTWGESHFLDKLKPESEKDDLKELMTIEDVEIRRVSAVALGLVGFALSDKDGTSLWEEKYNLLEHPDAPKTFDITFRNLIDEYNKCYNQIHSYYKSREGSSEAFILWFRQELSDVDESFTNFKDFMNAHNIRESDLVVGFIRKNYESFCLIKELHKLILSFGVNLFDAHLLMKIHEHSGKHIAVCVGAGHTGHVKFFMSLVDCWPYRDYKEDRENIVAKQYRKIRLLSENEFREIFEAFSYTIAAQKALRVVLLWCFATMKRVVPRFDTDRIVVGQDTDRTIDL